MSDFGFKEKSILFLIKTFGIPLVRILFNSYEVHSEGAETVLKFMEERKSFICAFWHQRLFLVTGYFRDTGGSPLVSMSKEGEYITATLKALGFNPVRGSTSRRSYESFRELYSILDKGTQIGITPDGPRGPSRIVQKGVLYLAKYSGRPIVPVGASADKFWIFNSWDRFIVPKFSSKVFFEFGNPIYVGRDASDDEMEIKRKELKQELDTLCVKADKSAGHEPLPQSRYENR